MSGAITALLRFGPALVFVTGPLFWLIATSLRPEAELGRLGLPSALELESYRRVLRDGTFPRVLANSSLVALGTTLLSLAVGAPAAFALAKLNLRGRTPILIGALAVALLPPIATVSPLYLLIRELGLRDRLVALVLTHSAFALPMTLWILSRFFRDIPDQLYEAACVDGCTPLQAFRRVLLPLALPGLGTAAILVFIFSYNEFLYALTFVSSPAKHTVPVALSLFASEHENPWGEITAASVLGIVPVVLLCAFCQRRIVAGLTAGALRD